MSTKRSYVIYCDMTCFGDNIHGFYANEDCPSDKLIDDKHPKITYNISYAKIYNNRDDAIREINDGVLDPIPGSFSVLEWL